MPCQTCYHSRGVRDGMVACSSIKHAKFMDIFETTRHQEMVKLLGAMPLRSCEAIKLECPDHKTLEEYRERKRRR